MDSYYIDQLKEGNANTWPDLYWHEENQSGDGIVGFQGVRYSNPVYMKGNGFFGRVIKGSVWPLLKTVGQYLFMKGKDQLGPAFEDYRKGKDIKDIAKRAGKRTAKAMLNDVANTIQEGDGVNRAKKKNLPLNIIKVSASNGKPIRERRGKKTRRRRKTKTVKPKKTTKKTKSKKGKRKTPRKQRKSYKRSKTDISLF